MLRKLAFSAAMLWLSSVGAGAEDGEFSMDDVADVDILPGWRTENGTHMAALLVRLAPGWKTYWRIPGEAGIPPRFDWTGSSNISAVAFHWPVPSVHDQYGLQSIGYANELVLPIELTPHDEKENISLRAEVELGICEDVCVLFPVSIAADLSLDGASDARIRNAIAAAPESADDAGLSGLRCTVESIGEGLRITAELDMPMLGRDETAVFELPDPAIWIDQVETRRQGGRLTAVAEMMPADNAPFLLDRSQIRITVLAEGRGVDIRGCAG